jgi:c-di-GMP-binding flagellar brake protein YcgR
MTSQEQHLSDPTQIVNLLRRLQYAHALIRMGCDLSEFTKYTVIIDIQPEHDFFLVDAITDAPWHVLLGPGTLLHLSGRLDGIKIDCDTAFDALISDNTAPQYRLKLPTNMLYRQRRRHYRARLAKEKPLPISLPLSVKHQITGQVVDISASGVCSRVDFSAASALAIAQAIHRAHIALPGHQTLTCDMALRSLRHFPEKGYSLIGSEFLHISPIQQQHVERLVAQLDRTHRRLNDQN